MFIVNGKNPILVSDLFSYSGKNVNISKLSPNRLLNGLNSLIFRQKIAYSMKFSYLSFFIYCSKTNSKTIHMIIKKLLATLLVFNTIQMLAQRPECGTMHHLAAMMEENPQLESEMKAYNAQIDAWIAANANGVERSESATIVIPLVFHIVYNTAEENISDAEIESQVVAMNADFMGTNADASKIPSVFKSLMGKPQIQFCLAKRTPAGLATNGIVHKSTTKTSFSDNDAVKYTAQGGDDAWDTKKYFNIWICDLGSKLLGYGEFPKTTATKTFGYVGHYKYTGTVNSKAPYNLGRTTTHEIGHCLNLRHIWGDQTCGDDLISDTPTQETSNSGCPSFPHVTCSNSPNGDMFMNYMDYVDDNCMVMFTKNQTTRMLAVINSAPYNSLTTSDGCVPPISTGVISITQENNIGIYPNPNEGIFNVSFNINEQISHSLEIRNVLGQVVYKEAIQAPNGDYSKVIDIQRFGKGTYTVLLFNEHRIVANKIIVY